jgi:hypothetical protein
MDLLKIALTAAVAGKSIQGVLTNGTVIHPNLLLAVASDTVPGTLVNAERLLACAQLGIQESRQAKVLNSGLREHFLIDPSVSHFGRHVLLLKNPTPRMLCEVEQRTFDDSLLVSIDSNGLARMVNHAPTAAKISALLLPRGLGTMRSWTVILHGPKEELFSLFRRDSGMACEFLFLESTDRSLDETDSLWATISEARLTQTVKTIRFSPETEEALAHAAKEIVSGMAAPQISSCERVRLTLCKLVLAHKLVHSDWSTAVLQELIFSATVLYRQQSAAYEMWAKDRNEKESLEQETIMMNKLRKLGPCTFRELCRAYNRQNSAILSPVLDRLHARLAVVKVRGKLRVVEGSLRITSDELGGVTPGGSGSDTVS